MNHMLFFLALSSIFACSTLGINVKICSLENRQRCVGIRYGRVSMQQDSDPTTIWRIAETTRYGGQYIQNLGNCLFLQIQGKQLTLGRKNERSQSQSWIVGEYGSWYSETISGS
eukprot:TRINITY_DN23250_c0_g1_i1.p1 TRINITY_DN23250_c0_g1~~TRINITY_DN23250_c0_g1_i1.p1  ORF type:complete len:114 (-),score=10.45 TRINITY_DN23250_c0_g1_i1:129-470(-)